MRANKFLISINDKYVDFFNQKFLSRSTAGPYDDPIYIIEKESPFLLKQLTNLRDNIKIYYDPFSIIFTEELLKEIYTIYNYTINFLRDYIKIDGGQHYLIDLTPLVLIDKDEILSRYKISSKGAELLNKARSEKERESIYLNPDFFTKTYELEKSILYKINFVIDILLDIKYTFEEIRKNKNNEK